MAGKPCEAAMGISEKYFTRALCLVIGFSKKVMPISNCNSLQSRSPSPQASQSADSPWTLWNETGLCPIVYVLRDLPEFNFRFGFTIHRKSLQFTAMQCFH